MRLATLIALRVVAGVLLLLLGVVARAAHGAGAARARAHRAADRQPRARGARSALVARRRFHAHASSFTISKIDDAEGVQALYARRIAARFDLAALVHHTVRIDDLDVDGADVLIRHLADNRVNFAALPPSDGRRDARIGVRRPIRCGSSSRTCACASTAATIRRVGHEAHALERPRGSFDIEGSADIRGADVRVQRRAPDLGRARSARARTSSCAAG